MVPIKNAKIIKSFGWVYEKGRRRFHDGIDIVSESGDTRVSAILHGRVLTCSECYMHDLHWGNREYIGAHQYCLMKCDINGDEYYFKYLNLKNLNFEPNQIIKAGQQIGEYDPQYWLHIGMYDYRWDRVDPTIILMQLRVNNNDGTR